MATLEQVLEHNEMNDFYPVDAVKAFYENADYSAYDPDEIVRLFSDAYLGCYEDVEEYARELLENTGDLSDLPHYLRNYFDYASFGRDLEYGGDIWTEQVGYCETYIFSNI
jgi:antirestriction protein